MRKKGTKHVVNVTSVRRSVASHTHLVLSITADLDDDETNEIVVRERRSSDAELSGIHVVRYRGADPEFPRTPLWELVDSE